jgi:hypothetical protein
MADKITGPRAFDDAKFLEKTGKTFTEWKKILDDFDVIKNGHTAAAKFLRSEYNTPDWWTQSIVVKYEWEVGLKKEAVAPKDLKERFKDNPVAEKNFNSFAESHKKEYINWIEEAKRPETRERRIAKTIEALNEGKKWI